MVVSASGFVVQRFSGGPLDLEPHRGVFEMGDRDAGGFFLLDFLGE